MAHDRAIGKHCFGGRGFCPGYGWGIGRWVGHKGSLSIDRASIWPVHNAFVTGFRVKGEPDGLTVCRPRLHNTFLLVLSVSEPVGSYVVTF